MLRRFRALIAALIRRGPPHVPPHEPSETDARVLAEIEDELARIPRGPQL